MAAELGSSSHVGRSRTASDGYANTGFSIGEDQMRIIDIHILTSILSGRGEAVSAELSVLHSDHHFTLSSDSRILSPLISTGSRLFHFSSHSQRWP